MPSPHRPDLILGEWACLGALAVEPAHGYAVARRFARDGDLGRVWTMSRPMVYRCVDALLDHALVEPVPGAASDGRGKLPVQVTRAGRRALHRWLDAPIGHLREVQPDLLLKLVLDAQLGRDPRALLRGQRRMAEQRLAALESDLGRVGDGDPVVVWRVEAARALLRTLDALAPARAR